MSDVERRPHESGCGRHLTAISPRTSIPSTAVRRFIGCSSGAGRERGNTIGEWLVDDRASPTNFIRNAEKANS